MINKDLEKSLAQLQKTIKHQQDGLAAVTKKMHADLKRQHAELSAVIKKMHQDTTEASKRVRKQIENALKDK